VRARCHKNKRLQTFGGRKDMRRHMRKTGVSRVIAHFRYVQSVLDEEQRACSAGRKTVHGHRPGRKTVHLRSGIKTMVPEEYRLRCVLNETASALCWRTQAQGVHVFVPSTTCTRVGREAESCCPHRH
jgi:hypothetical protein